MLSCIYTRVIIAFKCLELFFFVNSDAFNSSTINIGRFKPTFCGLASRTKGSMHSVEFVKIFKQDYIIFFIHSFILYRQDTLWTIALESASLYFPLNNSLKWIVYTRVDQAQSKEWTSQKDRFYCLLAICHLFFLALRSKFTSNCQRLTKQQIINWLCLTNKCVATIWAAPVGYCYCV